MSGSDVITLNRAGSRASSSGSAPSSQSIVFARQTTRAAPQCSDRSSSSGAAAGTLAVGPKEEDLADLELKEVRHHKLEQPWRRNSLQLH